MSDAYNLERFIQAQEPVYEEVVDELGDGLKQGHWMWFVFPQAAGLGSSEMSRKFAVASLAEARAYYAHPVLGQRLLECTRLVMDSVVSPEYIFGHLDAMKFRSCMSLFAEATGEQIFAEAMEI